MIAVTARVQREGEVVHFVVHRLADLSDRKNTLVVLDRDDEVTYLSVRNLPHVHVLTADQLNTYDVLVSDDVVFTKAAYDSFVAAASGSKQEDAK